MLVTLIDLSSFLRHLYRLLVGGLNGFAVMQMGLLIEVPSTKLFKSILAAFKAITIGRLLI